MTSFQIDADIRRARTLTSDFYTSAENFEASKDKIFGRTWQVIGDLEDAYAQRPTTLLEGFLDEPVLITRDGERVRCLSNVCTHRGKILVDEPCSGGLIRCGYHGRRFSLDGKFVSMPEFEDVEDFPSKRDDLAELGIGQWQGLLFASIEPLAPLDDFLRGFTPPQHRELSLTASRDYAVEAHWALYCENYLEGFHIPFVHKSLNEIVDYGTYRTETFRYASLQTGFDADGNIVGQYLFLFPNTMFNFYPWGVSINIVRPMTASSSIVSFLTYVADESKLEKGAGADLHRVELEDEKVVESVQKGIRSRFYGSGRYSPTREQGTHHFHRLIAEFME